MNMLIGPSGRHKEFTKCTVFKDLGGKSTTRFHEFVLEFSSKIGPSFNAIPESTFKGGLK